LLSFFARLSLEKGLLREKEGKKKRGRKEKIEERKKTLSLTFVFSKNV